MSKNTNSTLDIAAPAKSEELNNRFLYFQMHIAMMDENYAWQSIIRDNQACGKNWEVNVLPNYVIRKVTGKGEFRVEE